MKIIALGDVHMAPDYIHEIRDVAHADLIVVNGDLTNYGSAKEAKQVLDTLLSANTSLLAQFGNLDKPEINDYLEELDINMHNQARMVSNRVCLMGIGGSNYTPFDTPAEFSETELATFAQNGYDQARTFIDLAEPIEKIKIPLIVVSHTPPYKTTVDRLSDGRHVGSPAIRAFLEKVQPALCIAGHIHEAVGMDHVGVTPVYNPGMLGQGGWLEITVDKTNIQTRLHDRTT